ncbi:uncharacterized protein BDZ99DRAFT_514126 [Mytilinidion resinicola]|uniref:Uncharacterized protein n=1 Tax=Mytilinidion resinicola TaxID=574789 RepID=A0A6A6ZA63_9PEZI|nr:uncharacterized protein BDZ99DRAFT_514126 [Mytilinidion resinicola]KAF2817906.1 hypothetical protein BDZ99DRAFT_514126 [Mytilinidion resinicola]
MAPPDPTPESLSGDAMLQNSSNFSASESAVRRTLVETWHHVVEYADESKEPVFLSYELSSYGVSRKSSIDDETRSHVKTLLSLRQVEHFLGDMADGVLLNGRPYFFADLNQLAWFYADCLWDINMRAVYYSTSTATANDKAPEEIWAMIEAAAPHSLTLLPIYQPLDTLFGRALLGLKVGGEYVVRYHMEENLEILGVSDREKAFAPVMNKRFEQLRCEKLGLGGGLVSWRGMGLSDTPV